MRYKLMIITIISILIILGCSTTNTNNTTNDTSDPKEFNTRIWWEEVPDSTSFDLSGKAILVLIADQFNHQEITAIAGKWEEWGAEITIAGNKNVLEGNYWDGNNPHNIGVVGTAPLTVDILINDANADDYDLIFIPGGYSPGNLIRDKETHTAELVKTAYEHNKYLATSCHGPLVLAEADVIEGKQVTGWAAEVKSAIESAGGIYVIAPCIVDGLIISASWAYFGPLAINVAKCLTEN